MVAAQADALEGAQTAFVQPLSEASSMSEMGHSLPEAYGSGVVRCPPCPH
jgi:hypothetical protein